MTLSGNKYIINFIGFIWLQNIRQHAFEILMNEHLNVTEWMKPNEMLNNTPLLNIRFTLNIMRVCLVLC